MGFNGERPDLVTGHYLLGNGYRAFNPVLMRFNSPDSWSPFGKGGLNSYAYCGGDAVNRSDKSGHAPSTLSIYGVVMLKTLVRRQRIKIFEKRGRPVLGGGPANRNITSNEAINLMDEFRSVEDTLASINGNTTKQLNLEMSNTTTLKNISAGIVESNQLPLNTLPRELANHIKNPASSYNINKIHKELTLFDNTTKRPITYNYGALDFLQNSETILKGAGYSFHPETARIISKKIDFIRGVEYNKLSDRKDQIIFRLIS
jgi:RHS repeat-associated protein